jgi:SAM-dependent methyltransferase
VNDERHVEGAVFETKWRNRFREFAEDRDDDAGIAGWTKTGLESRIRRFLDVWTLNREGEVWLDAGCGAGTYTRILKNHGAVVVGVDYSPLAVRKAVARSDGVIQYAIADVRDLPFRADSFDGVICFGVTQALSDSSGAIDEIASLLKHGGTIWIDALNRWCVVHAVEIVRRRLTGRAVHLRYESPAAIRSLMAAAGIKNALLYWMPILPKRLQRWQGLVEAPLAKLVLRFVPMVGLLACHAFIIRGEKG